MAKQNPRLPKAPGKYGPTRRAKAVMNSLEALRRDLKPEEFAPDADIPLILNQNAARLLQLVARSALAPRSISL